MPGRLASRARSWSRKRFIAASVLVGLVCVALLILDGISAAVHFHTGVALFGILFFVVLLFWFRVIEARAGMQKKSAESTTRR